MARIVKGNEMRLAIPLTLRTLTQGAEGVTEATDTAFYPEKEVKVVLQDRARRYDYIAAVNGNLAVVTDMGRLPLGVYSVEVLTEDSQGRPLRFKQRSAVTVVDETAAAGIEMWNITTIS